MYNLSHVETEELTHLLNCRRLSKAVSCHHRSFPFVPPSAISRKRNPNFFASARVRNQSRCFVKRSAVLFFVSTRLTDLQRASVVRCIVALFDCRHVLLGGVSLHRHGVLVVPNQMKKIIHTLHQLVNFLFPSPASVEDIALRSVLLVRLLSRIHITMFRVIILGYHRQLFSQLLFMKLGLYSSEIFHLLALLRFHGNNKLIGKLVVFVSAVV